MKPLNWGIPPRGQDAEPGDLISTVIGEWTVIGIFVQDSQGDAIVVLNGYSDSSSPPPYLVARSRTDTPFCKVEGQPIVAPQDEMAAFQMGFEPFHKHGQLFVLENGDFAISLVEKASRLLYRLSDGTPVENAENAKRYYGWKLLLKLEGRSQPIEIFHSA